jgi:hypothetical protein
MMVNLGNIHGCGNRVSGKELCWWFRRLIKQTRWSGDVLIMRQSRHIARTKLGLQKMYSGSSNHWLFLAFIWEVGYQSPVRSVYKCPNKAMLMSSHLGFSLLSTSNPCAKTLGFMGLFPNMYQGYQCNRLNKVCPCQVPKFYSSHILGLNLQTLTYSFVQRAWSFK